jgi:hypothetical protein
MGKKALTLSLSLRDLAVPRNNAWMKRIILAFAFILFDYASTLAFCRNFYEEANPLARLFMENLGIFSGLTLFVLLVNVPIYVTLSVDSHVVKLPSKLAVPFEIFVDIAFAWWIAGVHFVGGSSWFWAAPDLVRQALGTTLYLGAAFVLIKPWRMMNNH